MRCRVSDPLRPLFALALSGIRYFPLIRDPAKYRSHAKLAWQTFGGAMLLLGWVPKPRDQSDPERVAEWARARALVGQRIRQVRTRRGLTQEALALRSGFSRNLLVDVELGKSGLLYERLFDLAAALEVSPHEFLMVGDGAVVELELPPAE
ncbi:hypothetical protein MTY66_58170 [Mycolicibacterium sp. TY66]|nr:hypothetical protein MTY66_58170 [Mycolicibacterium sp. TY66]BCJ84187.1 hypothetical protein MTY81_55600 [Mycolicibacterium sp. TY81]